MELYGIRCGNRDALLARQYNIGIGISLGNKWFTADNVLGLVRWALPLTREVVIVYVADTIHAINIEVRNRKPHDIALERAKKMGADLLQQVRERADRELAPDEAARIVYGTWSDLEDAAYRDLVDYLRELFAHDPEFSAAIRSLVLNQVAGETKRFSPDDVTRLCDYIIEEMPELLNRMQIKGHVYDADVYPFDGELTRLIEQIQIGNLFPHVRDRIANSEPKVFLEVR